MVELYTENAVGHREKNEKPHQIKVCHYVFGKQVNIVLRNNNNDDNNYNNFLDI